MAVLKNRTVYYVSFPLSEYQDICDAIRDILGVTGPITSGQIPEYVAQIKALGSRTLLTNTDGSAIETDDEHVLVNEEVGS